MRRQCSIFIVKGLVVVALAAWSDSSMAQHFVYTERGNPVCPVVAPLPSSPSQTVKIGAPVAGSIRVSCGFDKGSYTVTLGSSDANATFSPTTFLVNFGSVSGSGKFTVTFATPGSHTLSAVVTSNMGSPPLSGRFASETSAFEVVSH